MTIAEFWPQCLQLLQQQLPVQQYKTWIAPLTVGEENGQWLVYAPTHFLLGHIKKQFWPQMLDIKAQLDPDNRAELVLKVGRGQLLAAAPKETEVKPADTTSQANKTDETRQILDKRLAEATENQAGKPATTLGESKSSSDPAQSKTALKKDDQHNLNANLTFDTLVVGKGNQIAVAAARNISERPGIDYNPFFLYSSPGLGKTHLVQAIGHALLGIQPKARVAYVHADDYVRSLMSAARTGAYDAFKQKYKPYDLLILDDVQLIAGKDRTMEEFFYLFNHFHTEQKQIILTSDVLPDNIEGMDARLKTRFSSGLTLRLEPPELEMRVAILQKKAELAQIALEEEAAFFIAKHIQGSVRYLEGAFNRVAASSRFTHKPIDIDLAAKSLQDIVASAHKIINVEMIMAAVSEYYRISLSDLLSKKRTRNIAWPRQMAMSLTKELTNLSLPAIGHSFGGRDHTTILHGVDAATKRRKEDPKIEQDYQKLLILIKN